MSEGTADFKVAGLSEPCQTWYKIFGDLNTSATPLIILHGGPGACHNYLLPLTDLANSRPVIFYDQIGNGLSTHLTSKAGDEAFWSIDLFKDELDNLLSHLGLRQRPIDVYGHSWGGMLAVEWAATPSGAHLRRLILSSSLASMCWIMQMKLKNSKLPNMKPLSKCFTNDISAWPGHGLLKKSKRHSTGLLKTLRHMGRCVCIF
jgi:proline-specific peptidase